MRLSVLALSILALPGLAIAVASPAAAATQHPKVSIARNHKSIRVGASVTISGKVAPNEHGHKVELQRYSGHKWHNQRSAKLSSSSHYRFTVKPATRGTYTYRVHDAKAKGWKAASSKKITVTVKKKKKSTAPAGCYPLTNGGKCYEPGEFCRDDDHGTSGRAGDGEAIACKDNNGWRWEPV